MKPVLTQPYNESALVTSLQAGHLKAFDELYTRFAPKLLRVIFHYTHDRDQAQDLLQDSFLKIWRNLHRYDPAKGGLFTWILTITRNTTFRYLSSNHTYSSIDDIAVEIIGVTTPTYQTIGVTCWVDSTLSGNELIMIKLVYFEGYTFQEVSDEFGFPLGSVKTYVRRALQRLRVNS
ncbi:sigma-70 family RNA polymerase sigma factor [Spirosoma spitsbergense]|uniref:RNA polymerase sigma factor n=1 Tax=Spirosoma spitsbergense TaxID=431554 RepID=UPI000373331D